MKKLKQFFRHHRLSRGWRIVRHPAAILAKDVVELGAVEYLVDKRAVLMYKAQGARATDPGRSQCAFRSLLADFSALEILVVRFGLAWADSVCAQQ